MGRGEGPLLKKASPPKPAGAARVPYPLEAFRLVGRRSTVGWGWGKVRQVFTVKEAVP